jgi:hypothetical protein
VDGLAGDGSDQVSARPGQQARSIDGPAVTLASVRTAADFARCLDHVRILAGPLSHREIEGRAGGRLRRTKIGQVLAGELPRRDFLEAYLEVCGVPEDARGVWHQVWIRLVSHTPAVADEAGLLRKQLDAALTQVRRLANELAALRVDRDAANQRLQQTGEILDATQRRLRTTEEARDEALAHIQRLDEELAFATSRLSEARSDIASRHAVASSPKALVRYTRGEAETLYGSDATTMPPVLGQGG